MGYRCCDAGPLAAVTVTKALGFGRIVALRAAWVDRISGRKARRATLARTFATEAEVCLLDEPTADLDPAAQHAIMRLLRATTDAGRTVVAVLHALDRALRNAHRMVVLAGRRVPVELPDVQSLPAAAAAIGLRFSTHAELRLLPPD